MREVEIERLVQWALRDELPKRSVGETNGWDSVGRYGELLSLVDDEPGFPIAMGVPHVDADTIDRAIGMLRDEVAIDWREYRELLAGDIIGIAPVNDPMPGRVFSESALVATFGRMGLRPTWNADRPRAVPVVKRGVVMLIGHCKGLNRYEAGSHTLLRYMPDVASIAFRRAEYMIWRDGLVRLAGMLRAWTLRDHVALLPPAAPAYPWLDGVSVRRDPIKGVAPAWPNVDEARAVPRGARQRAKPKLVPEI